VARKSASQPPKVRARKITTWNAARKLKIYRRDPFGFYAGALEPGVNFFVLMLEQLGAITEFSCEGHPTNFYVVFSAAPDIAYAIRRCGFFNVEVEGENRWSIRMYGNAPTTLKQRDNVLKLAAISWVRTFGPLLYLKEHSGYPEGNSAVPQ
jgi:hypothetical protein